MYPKLYLSNTQNFTGLGEGILKDTLSCYVVHERNGQYDLELEHMADSRLASKLVKGNIIKADAGKRYKGQLFRIYNIGKSLENKIKIYAYHISYDLKRNVVPRINLTNVSCINALNSIKANAILPVNFNFYTDITHTANYNVEGADCLSCLGGMEGSIIDTYGNGANIVRDNFNISVMQNIGYDNNILISYKKNLLSLDYDDDEYEITGIYPYVKNESGIDENTDTVTDFIELPEKVIYRADYKDFKIQNIVPVDLSGKNINSVEELRKAGTSHLKDIIGDNISIKVDFLDKTKLDDFEGVSQLQDLDLYDSVIIRYMKLDVNYKSKINKVKYNVLTEEYEELTIGKSRTNLSDTVTSTNDFIKQEINKTNNSWQQSIEHATSQITGNSGGYVRMWPPNKPSEIFIMDKDDVNKAKNILRMNKQGIGFSKNGINGPFETAWTSDGVFYANWITAGILSAIMLQNADESLQIDLSGTDGIMTKKNGKNAIELAGTILKFFDWDGEGEPIGQLYSARLDGNENAPGIALANRNNSYLTLCYEKDGKFYSYIRFDKDNIDGTTDSPVTVFEETDFKNYIWVGHGINSIYNSTKNNFVNRVKNSFVVVDAETLLDRLNLSKNQLNLYDVEHRNIYSMISAYETFFASNGQKYFSAKPGGFSFWKDGDDVFYTTVADTIQVDRAFHINGDFTVNGNKNCVQTTENYGDRLFYSVEDCESYLTDRSMELFTVKETAEGTYERVILLDNIFKESVNLDIEYTVEIIKQGWGDYRIKEQTKDYFIIESDRKDFTFKYVITGKRKGFEDERNKELFKTYKTEDSLKEEYWRLYSRQETM